MKNFKTYAFWVALSSAIVILIQSVGKLFGFEIESSLIENVIMSICGVLVVLGIVARPTEETSSEEKETTDNDNDKDGDNEKEEKADKEDN